MDVSPFAVIARLGIARPAPVRKLRRRLAALAGGLLTFGLLLCLGEAFLRVFPPADLHKYLGDRAPGKGIYKPDPILGADYSDFEAFAMENQQRLAEFLPLPSANREKPLWAFFGNSFVQMQGMLGDTAKADVPTRRIFHLGRNEPLHLRVAQIRMLLESGLKPERIFFAVMPLDTSIYGHNRIADIRVNRQGVVTYRPPVPASLEATGSRLALAAWLRIAQPLPNIATYTRRLYTQIPKELLEDTGRVFGELANSCAKHDVPVTVILIPTHEQITRGFGHAFQDHIGEQCRSLGMDVFDARDSFTHVADKAGLFIPDKHFSAAGNAILLAALLKHPGIRP